MSKKAVVWIRDDFRIKNNSALSYATNNYDTVTALYIIIRKISMMLEKHKNGG